MNNLIKLVCLILITFAILIGVGFYAWDISEEQAYFQEQEQESRNKSRF